MLAEAAAVWDDARARALAALRDLRRPTLPKPEGLTDAPVPLFSTSDGYAAATGKLIARRNLSPEFRDHGGDDAGPARKPTKPRGDRTPRPVIGPDGTFYASAFAAAPLVGFSQQMVTHRAAKGVGGWRYAGKSRAR